MPLFFYLPLIIAGGMFTIAREELRVAEATKRHLTPALSPRR